MAQMSSRPSRRLDFLHPALAKQSLSTRKPPVDSISWKLWLACQDLAGQALESKYLQGIKNGNLNPNSYGQYTVQDAAYSYNAQADYETLESRALAKKQLDLAAFAQARYLSYQSYNKTFLKTWHISDGGAVTPGAAARAYIEFEHRVANSFEPVYGIIAMLPCEELWPWLAGELKASVSSTNLYSFWIEENRDWHGAYRLDNFIDSWFAQHSDEYSWEKALYVMRSCMTCEVNLFRSACDQDLLPMPEQP